MSFTYKQAHEYLDSLMVFGVKLGLQNMQSICRLLGNPQDDLQFIHVAGTNGKGSCCSMLAAAFKNCGTKTAFYSSPFLCNFTERWRINGFEVNEEQVTRAIKKIALLDSEIEKETGARPTYFEVLTAAALFIFKEADVELVIWETGLGGRLDATNVVQPLISLITNIEKDHTQFLGETLKEIAFEKAGIIKADTPVVLGDLKPDVQSQITGIAKSRNSFIRTRGIDFDLQCNDYIEYEGIKYRQASYKSSQHEFDVLLPFIGIHQADNAAAVVTVIEEVSALLEVDFDVAIAGLKQALWPGRMDIQKNGLMLDGAHNPVAAKALVASLVELSPGKKYHFVCGVLKDKEWQEMLDILSEVASSFYFVDIKYDRSSSAVDLADYMKKQGFEVTGRGSSEDALAQIEKPEDTVAGGSLYLIGELLALLNGGKALRIDRL